MWSFTLFLQCNFILNIFSDLKLNQTLYLGLILFPSQRLLWLHLKEPKKDKKCDFSLFFTVFYIFSDLKLNQTLYLGLILFPSQRSWWLHLKSPKKFKNVIFHFIFTVYFYFVPIFRSEIESNPISRPYIVSSAKIMVTALKRAKTKL